MSRKEVSGRWAFAFPLLGIIGLLTTYLLLADWQTLPSIIGSALTTLNWPN